MLTYGVRGSKKPKIAYVIYEWSLSIEYCPKLKVKHCQHPIPVIWFAHAFGHCHVEFLFKLFEKLLNCIIKFLSISFNLVQEKALPLNAMHFNKSTTGGAQVMVIVTLKIQMFVNEINGIVTWLAQIPDFLFNQNNIIVRGAKKKQKENVH